jgi:hypothetical protein
MPVTADASVSKLLDQTMEQFGSAMKVGVKMQEEAARWFADAVSQIGSAQEWQKRSRAMLADAIPTAQRSADEYLRLFDQSYRTSMDLMKKAVNSSRSESAAEAQAKAQELIEQYMATMRSNAQAMAEANLHAMQSWSEFIRKNFEFNGAPAPKQT